MKVAARRFGVFLLLFAGAAVAAASDVPGSLVQWAGLLIAGVGVPVLLQFRRETRDTLHDLRAQIHALAVKAAVLEERDRIGELLDKRLPKS